LSDKKTSITHTSDGFDFLGFNIRKYTERSPKSKYHRIGKLLIKPQKEKALKVIRKIQETLDNNKTAKQSSIINMLNPIIQGYGLYNRFVVSKETFSSIDNQTWYKQWRWAKRRHPNKPKKWIKRKYFTTNGRKWVLKDEIGNKIRKMESIPIVRYVKIKNGVRVHANDKETKEYWQERIFTNALSQVYSIKAKSLMKTQKGICPVCGRPITGNDMTENKVHVHHMLPRSRGGTVKLNNLRLLHQGCHVLVHQVLTRDEMALWMKKKLNYVSKPSIVYFQSHPEKTGDGGAQAIDIKKAVKSESTKRVMDKIMETGARVGEALLQKGRI
jgi:RNA-directed DNA polymerase